MEEIGFSPLDFRYLTLTTHYKKPLSFTLKKLGASKISRQRLKNIILTLKDDGKTNEEYLVEFEKAVNDNLNMPDALQVLWKLLRNEKAEGKIQTIKRMDEVFGLDLLEKEKIEITKEVKKLVGEREKMREEKNWKKSDEIRNKIKALGYIIEDSEKGAIVKKL